MPPPTTRSKAPSDRSKEPSDRSKEPSEEAVWLPGFAWAVPAAFSGPVSACRFEQGDVLHESRSGYGDWRGGVPGAWIQVLDPPRSARAVSGGADAGRFAASWGAPVELELDDGGGGPVRRLGSTQGRLFTCLWRADVAALESKSAPEVPLLQVDLQRSLEQALPAVRRALGAGKSKRGSAAAKRAASAALFVATVDRAGDASVAKAESIHAALASRFEVTVHEASPVDLGLPEAERYHPPLRVRALRVDGADEDRVTAALKEVLYSPGARGRDAATDVDASGEAAGVDGVGGAKPAARTDRFSLARHGLLVPLEPQDEGAGS